MSISQNQEITVNKANIHLSKEEEEDELLGKQCRVGDVLRDGTIGEVLKC